MTPIHALKIFKKEFERCCKLCGMTDWLIDYESDEDDGNIASVAATYSTKRCTVFYDAKELTKYSTEEIRKIAAHEAAHLLVAPMAEVGPDHADAGRREEGVVNRIACILRRVRCTKS